MTVRTRLRAATHEAHERVDAAFASYDLANRAAYGEFLRGHAAAFMPIERSLELAGAATIAERWGEHRRGPLLAQDLAALGLVAPPPIAAPDFGDPARLVGGLYVLEGSRLGGAVLRRCVPADAPAAFLSAPQSPGHWTRFVAIIERLLYSPQRLDAAIGAALDTFACFEQAALRMRVA